MRTGVMRASVRRRSGHSRSGDRRECDRSRPAGAAEAWRTITGPRLTRWATVNRQRPTRFKEGKSGNPNAGPRSGKNRLKPFDPALQPTDSLVLEEAYAVVMKHARRMRGWIDRDDREPVMLSGKVVLRSGRSVAVRVLNISRGGRRIQCEENLPIATTVRFEVGDAIANANVRWSIAGEAGLQLLSFASRSA
jgi:hypothetical protein